MSYEQTTNKETQDFGYTSPRDMCNVEKDIGGDNWKHRNLRMSCKTCMWYMQKINTLESIGKGIGRCKKHAPTMSGFPVVFGTDWCGDHKLDESK